MLYVLCNPGGSFEATRLDFQNIFHATAQSLALYQGVQPWEGMAGYLLGRMQGE